MSTVFRPSQIGIVQKEANQMRFFTASAALFSPAPDPVPIKAIPLSFHYHFYVCKIHIHKAPVG